MRAAMGRLFLAGEARTTWCGFAAPEKTSPLLRSEIAVSRIILICALAALLAACGAQSTNRTALTQERLACADVGIDPGSAAFGRCVVDLSQSLWEEQMLDR
jgi:hypothetical protein